MFVLETSITYNKDKCTLNCFVHCNFKITLKWEVSSRLHVYFLFNYM